MLVCSVSMRARRTVAAMLAEAAAATDTVNTLGLGQLVSEAASASDVVNASSIYGAAIIEAASALDTSSASLTIAGVFAVIETATATDVVNANLVTAVAAVAETATAIDAPDAASVAASAWAAWDPATVANVTLSGGNLVATNTVDTSTDQGARVADSAVKEYGKYYFEDTFTTVLGLGTALGSNYGVGIGTTTSTYPGMGASHGVSGAIVIVNGTIFASGAYTGIDLGAPTAGSVIGVAVDIDNRRVWFRLNGGNWNDNAGYDPATNVGGVTIPAGQLVPFVTFGGSIGSDGTVQTANFGATTFAYTVPSGFDPGWSKYAKLSSAVAETASATDVPDATGGTTAGVGHTAMLPSVMVNAGTSRQANVNGIMLNQ